jgi:hypothetical protein
MSEGLKPEGGEWEVQRPVEVGSLINYQGELYKVATITGDKVGIHEVGKSPISLIVVDKDSIKPIRKIGE